MIEGYQKLSPQSDIFSLGSVLYSCIDRGCFNDIVSIKTGITCLADRCHALNLYERPKANAILEELQVLSLLETQFIQYFSILSTVCIIVIPLPCMDI